MSSKCSIISYIQETSKESANIDAIFLTWRTCLRLTNLRSSHARLKYGLHHVISELYFGFSFLAHGSVSIKWYFASFSPVPQGVAWSRLYRAVLAVMRLLAAQRRTTRNTVRYSFLLTHPGAPRKKNRSIKGPEVDSPADHREFEKRMSRTWFPAERDGTALRYLGNKLGKQKAEDHYLESSRVRAASSPRSIAL